jgi:WD40 repeat protein
VYDTSVTGEQALSLLHGHTTPLNGLRFYGDDSHAVSIASDGTLRLWKLPPRIMTADSEE